MAAWCNITSTLTPVESNHLESQQAPPQRRRQTAHSNGHGSVPPAVRNSEMENRTNLARPNSVMDTLPADDLFLCLRPILAVGKIIIAVPLNGLFRLNKEKLPEFTFWSSFVFVGFTVYITCRCALSIVLLGVNIVLQTSRFFEVVRHTMFCVIENACHIHMLRKAPMILKLFATWREMNTRPWWLGQQSNLKWKIPGIGALLFCTIFIENWINTFRLVAKRGESSKSNNLTLLAAVVDAEVDLISTAFPDYPLIFGLIFFIEHKITLYQSTFRAIISICLIIAIESKLEALICRINTGPVNWGAARQDFLSLSKIIDIVNEIVSVFLFQMLTINLFFTTSSIYLAVAADQRSLQDGLYTILSITYLLMRFFFLCIPAGNIHGASQRIWIIVQQSSDKEYDSEAQRLERLVSQPVGISCMGLFTINHTFIVSFINAVFTLLILMLQAGKKISEML